MANFSKILYSRKDKFAVWSSLLAFILILNVSCSRNEDYSRNCSFQLSPIKVNFNLVDKTTNEDLFFTSNARFSTKDLYLFKKKDVARKDTIRPSITGSGTNRSFQYVADYYPLQDTLILKTGNLPDNLLILTSEKTTSGCTNYKLSSVSFNGATIGLLQDKYIFSE